MLRSVYYFLCYFHYLSPLPRHWILFPDHHTHSCVEEGFRIAEFSGGLPKEKNGMTRIRHASEYKNGRETGKRKAMKYLSAEKRNIRIFLLPSLTFSVIFSLTFMAKDDKKLLRMSLVVVIVRKFTLYHHRCKCTPLLSLRSNFISSEKTGKAAFPACRKESHESTVNFLCSREKATRIFLRYGEFTYDSLFAKTSHCV